MLLQIKIKCIICYSVSILTSTVLSYMVIRYKRECPQNQRNYLPAMQKKQKLRSATGQLERLLPDTDLSKRNNDLRSISALSRVPVIKATV